MLLVLVGHEDLPENINGSILGSITSHVCGELCNSEDLRIQDGENSTKTWIGRRDN